MKWNLLILALLCSAASGRVVAYHPLDIKLGQWEATTTRLIRVGWADKMPKTTVSKTCLSDIDEPWTIVYDGCQRCFKTLQASTGKKLEIRLQWGTGAFATTMRMKAKDSENVKGSYFIPVVGDVSFTAKWTGPDCSQ
jgi:hypothetical protein